MAVERTLWPGGCPVALVDVPARRRRELGDVEGLMASIAARGLIQPIVVLADATLIAGYRRWEAVRRLGWERVPAIVARDLESALEQMLTERDENTCREALRPTEAVALADLLRPLEEAAARGRQQASQAQAGRRVGASDSDTPSAPRPRRRPARTDARLARAVGMGRTRLRSATRVVRAAEAAPESLGDLPDAMDRTSVHAAESELRRRQDATALPEPAGPAPAGVELAAVEGKVRGWLATLGGVRANLASFKAAGGRLDAEQRGRVGLMLAKTGELLE